MGKGSPCPGDSGDFAVDPNNNENQVGDALLAEDYVNTLSPELRRIAKKELREDDKCRQASLDQMRQFVRKSPWLVNCRMDNNFLLRFLRHKKFSVPLAQDTLVKYVMMRQTQPEWYQHTSLHDPVVLDLINRGVAFALPQKDKHGRRCLFTVGGNIDPSIHTAEQVMKAIMVSFESLLEDEENQIRGFSYILDEQGITLAHLSLWNPTEISKVWSTCERAMPMRHKRLDFISIPPLLNYVYEFAKSLMSHKLRSRIVLHKDRKTFEQNADPKILPKEYGGSIPMAEMIEMYKAEVESRQARLLALDHMRIDLDAMKNSVKGPTTLGKDIVGINGSFRKLEID